MEQEWQSYGPDTKRIATAFTSGINAYIKALNGKRPLEFQFGGYDPGLWEPEDCLARVAGHPGGGGSGRSRPGTGNRHGGLRSPAGQFVRRRRHAAPCIIC